MQNTIQISNVSYFIGGAADKTRERFGVIKWGPTHLMGLAKEAFDQQKGACCETHYFSYLERENIVKNIVQQKLKNADVRINLVGHSRGGAVANAIVINELPAFNVKANIVVLLDPVKAKPSDNITIPHDKNATNTNTYICVIANPRTRDPTDYVALMGGQYAACLQGFCDCFIKANANHGQPMKMLKTVLDDMQFSAWDLLINDSMRA